MMYPIVSGNHVCFVLTQPGLRDVMSESSENPAPQSINLHQKSRLLEVSFADGKAFNLPCEYLRVYAPEASGQPPVHGKARVNITAIEPQGQEALQLTFDDGHRDSYSWPLLYSLGEAYADNWAAYLERLGDAGLTRGDGRGDDPRATFAVTVFYFIQLAEIAGNDSETLQVPVTVSNVQTLLAWLRKRGPDWAEAFMDDKVTVTVNKQFAELFTLIEPLDEVAIVPAPQ